MANKPFSEYYAEALAAQGASPVNTPEPPKRLKFNKVAKQGGGPEKPFNFLDWGIDILSRPLYAVTEGVDSFLESIDEAPAVREKFGSGDIGGALSDVAGSVGRQITSGIRGLTSTDENDKRLSHQLIEKGTDVVGKQTNPEYVDEQDNVNPIAKGVLGFIGDVAADPLTWLPGAVVGKGLQVAGRGAKAVGAGAKGAAKGAKEAVEARRLPTPAKDAEEIADLQRQAEMPEPIAPAAAAPLPEGMKLGGVKNVEEVSGPPITPLKIADEPAVSAGVPAVAAATKAYEAGRRLGQKITDQEVIAERLANVPEEMQEFFQKGIDEAFEKPKGGVRKAFSEWYSQQGAAAAPDVANVAEDVPVAAVEEVVEAPPQRTAQEAAKAAGYPDADDVIERAMKAADDTGKRSLRTGVLSKSGVEQALKMLDEDPKMKELLDEEIAFDDGSVFDLRAWVRDVLGDEDPADFRANFDAVLENLNDTGKFDMGPATVRESVGEIIDEAPVVPEGPVSMANPERLAGMQQLLGKMGDRNVDDLTFEQYIRIKATDPKTADAPAVDITRKGEAVAIPWKHIERVLREGTPGTQLYDFVLAETYKAFEKGKPALKGQATKWNNKTPIERFNAIVLTEDGEKLAHAAMGSALTTRLKAIQKDEGQFKTVMAEIGDVVNRLTNLKTITAEHAQYAQTRQLLKRLGVEVQEAAPVPSLSPTSHVTEAVGAAEKAADASKPAPVTDARQAIIDSTTAPGEGATQAERLARMTPEQEDVAQIVTDEIGVNVFGIGQKRPYKSKRGAEKTHKKYGEGYANWAGRINAPTQHDISAAIFQSLGKNEGRAMRGVTGKLPSAGRARAIKAKEQYMRRAKIVHELFDRNGIAPHLGIDADDVMMSDYQLRAVLERFPELSNMLLYNITTGIPTTNLYAAVSAMLRGATDDDLIKILQSNDTALTKKSYVNPLAGQGTRYYGHRTFGGKKPQPSGAGGTWVPNKKSPGWYFLQYTGDELTRASLLLLKEAKDDLAEVAAKNAEAWSARVDVETGELTAASRAWLEEIVTDPSKMGLAIRATAEPEKMVNDLAKDAGATQESVTLSTLNSQADIPIVDSVSAQGAARNADKQVSTGDPQAGQRGAQETQERLITMVDDEAAEAKLQAAKAANDLDPDDAITLGVTDDIADISTATAEQIDISIRHALNPNANGLMQRLGRAFVANFDHSRISRFRHSAEVASAWRRHEFISEIGRLVNAHGGVVKGARSVKGSLILKQAWNAIRTGGAPSDPAVAAAVTDLERIFGTMFDTTKQESVLGNAFFRNPVSADHVNGELLAVGLKDARGEDILFDIGAAEARAGGDKSKVMQEMVEQWRTWDIDDPAEAMLKLFTAVERVSTKAVTGQNLKKFAFDNGYASRTVKPGFAEPMASGKSIFISMLPDYDAVRGASPVYYDKEILKELSNLEAFMSGSRSFSGGPGQFVHGFFDPMQQSWKFGMTVVRPGHHVRNLVGDASMTYLAEGMRYSLKANHDAIKVLAAMRSGKYTGYDFNLAMEGLGLPKVPGGSDTLMSGKRHGDLTIQQAFEAFYERGLMNSYRHSEDVLDASSGGFSSFMNKVSLRGGKVEDVAGSVSQARDHYARMQHFLQYAYKALKDDRFKSMEELLDNAAHQVKKYHPDGSMLTPFEAKYMRRIIPFYSWLRGALPALVEASVLKPSRVTVFPKASLNLAVAMGVNPDSLTNPFPEDQLFPSFLSDQVFGPQFGDAGSGYFGFSPGIASVDVANQFLAGAPIEGTIRGIAGSTSPLFRIPAELLSGGSWGTGARINDASDYIDSNLPGVNYLSNISGYSVTGSLFGGGPDEQLQVARGNKTEVDKMLSLANWLSGASVQNMSRPNYINYAEIEKRNAAAENGDESRSTF